MSEQMILLGDEAVAAGAIHAGISSSYAYPGTPATEIHEAIQKYATENPSAKINCSWSINEKVAYEEAVGCSMIGKRVLVSMKHVGLNVAADPFINSAITGTAGGLVVAVGDDPSMHSSQNEQDSRYLAYFASIPAFEPKDSQQAYDMTREAFALSERVSLPVMVRLTTRVAHTRSAVRFSKPESQLSIKRPEKFERWTLLPSNARLQYDILLKKQSSLINESEKSKWNTLHMEAGAELGVVASGNAINLLKEVLTSSDVKCCYLEIGQFPLPTGKLLQIMSSCQKLLIIEDGYPVIEQEVLRYAATSRLNIQILGRRYGERVLPMAGELTPELVALALGIKTTETKKPPQDLIRPRPPQLCAGCPHVDTYKALNIAIKDKKDEVIIFGDIGCYTLGFYPPFNTIQSCLCMGASVSMAKAAGENGLKYSIGIIGDSTFNHSGIAPLLEGIKRNTPFTIIILDNGFTAMTGGQETLYVGSDLDKLILGLGLEQEHLKIIKPMPNNTEENAKILEKEIEYRGPSVIIARMECIQAAK